MSHNFENLKAHILPLSVEQSRFEIARLEWSLVEVYLSDDLDHCPCGKEIREICKIQNRLNHNETHVGNICVGQFMGIDTGNLFAGLKRISRNNLAKPNADLIKHAMEKGYIYPNEVRFLSDIRLRRNELSERQKHWLRAINTRILRRIVET